MGLLVAGQPFPRLTLERAEGGTCDLSQLWSQGDALFLVGHRNCKTTRETLPYVERLYRRSPSRERVLVVLQDPPREALDLARELNLTLPLACEADPYLLSQALGVEIVPSLLLVARDGALLATCEAFRKPDLDALAVRMGVAGSLFEDGDRMPPMKPG